MDSYVCLYSESSTGFTLRTINVPVAFLSAIPLFFGEYVSMIEAATTLFGVDLASLSISEPVLPLSFSYPSFKRAENFDIRTIPSFACNLVRWSFTRQLITAGIVPGYTPPPILAEWEYTFEDIPVYSGIYDYIDGRIISEMPDGSTSSSSMLGNAPYSADITLLRKTYALPAPGTEICVIPDDALQYHYEGGTPDFSQYSVVSGQFPRYNLVARELMPDGVDYKGTNVFYVSPEFRALIEIDAGGYGSNSYYFLELKGCGLHPQSSRRTLPPEKAPIAAVPVVLSMIPGSNSFVPELPSLSNIVRFLDD